MTFSSLVFSFGIIVTITSCHASAAKLATKPQMGWNTWNTFKSNISASLIEDTADLFVSLGLKDAGYEYLVIDEGWQTLTRDNSTGRQAADPVKFPSGIAPVADYVHSKGLKLGIYSDAGIYDCDFYPGSWGYEELDAETYSEWGIDYLKYDNCGSFQAGEYSPYERFAVMRDALRNSGRDIFYSLCNWGNQFSWFWADQTGHSFRMSGDIHNDFSVDKSGVCTTAYCLNTGYAGCSVLTIIRKMRELSLFQKQGAWLDLDMLEIGNGVLNEAQERTHFSFWAALKSPLVIGADLRGIERRSLEVLLQEDLIGVNGDGLGHAAHYLPDVSVEGEYQVWAGPLEDKKAVVLVLNEGKAGGFSTDFAVGNLTGSFQSVYSLEGYESFTQAKEVWTGATHGVGSGKLIVADLGLNDTAVYILS